MDRFAFNTAKSIRFGTGTFDELAKLVNAQVGDRIMLVTDPGMMATGMVERALKQFRDGGITVELFKDVEADPPEHVVLGAVAAARSAGVEGIVGLGGGSSLDVAKLVALLVPGTETLADVYGVGKARGPRLPLILVPTTAGTGSEVTPISIVTTGATQKTGIVSKRLLPDFAILDAQLTVGLPSHVSAATGVDAMVHAIEAFTSKAKKNVYSDMLAKQALLLLSTNIRQVCADGSDLDARKGMLLGSMLAGQAFANAPVAAVHALAYPLGGHFHLPHGLSNSLVLPPVLRFIAGAASALYAQLLDYVKPGSALTTDSAKCDAFIEEMESIIDDVKLPKTLRDCGIGRQDLPTLASDAMLQQRLLINNPVDVTEQDALKIYNSIY